MKNEGSAVAGGIVLLLVSMAFWLSASAKNLQRGAEMGTQMVFTVPPERERGTGSLRPPNAPNETAPFGLWRITTPTVVRSAATDASPEVVRLPVGAALWPIEVGQTWSRVRGRAGTVVYTGYVRTSSMTRTDR
jgi:hypothetical protein